MLKEQSSHNLLQCHVIDSDVDVDAAQRAMQEYTQVRLMKLLWKAV